MLLSEAVFTFRPVLSKPVAVPMTAAAPAVGEPVRPVFVAVLAPVKLFTSTEELAPVDPEVMVTPPAVAAATVLPTAVLIAVAMSPKPVSVPAMVTVTAVPPSMVTSKVPAAAAKVPVPTRDPAVAADAATAVPKAAAVRATLIWSSEVLFAPTWKLPE